MGQQVSTFGEAWFSKSCSCLIIKAYSASKSSGLRQDPTAFNVFTICHGCSPQTSPRQITALLWETQRRVSERTAVSPDKCALGISVIAVTRTFWKIFQDQFNMVAALSGHRVDHQCVFLPLHLSQSIQPTAWSHHCHWMPAHQRHEYYTEQTNRTTFIKAKPVALVYAAPGCPTQIKDLPNPGEKEDVGDNSQQ